MVIDVSVFSCKVCETLAYLGMLSRTTVSAPLPEIVEPETEAVMVVDFEPS
jgi:hypothetical protein